MSKYLLLSFTSIALNLFMASILIAPLAAVAQENGGYQVKQIVGPHEIGVTVIPSNLSLGRVQFIVTVLNAATRQPVSDAQVRIRTRSVAHGTEGFAIALNGPAAPERYEALVRLDGSGVWQADVEVLSRVGDSLVEMPPLNVPDTRQFTAGSLVFVVAFLVVLLGGIYVGWRIRQEQRKRAATPAPEEPLETTPPES